MARVVVVVHAGRCEVPRSFVYVRQRSAHEGDVFSRHVLCARVLSLTVKVASSHQLTDHCA